MFLDVSSFVLARSFRQLAVLLVTLFSLMISLASAQTLILTNGVTICSALTNTTVTLSNRSELRLTATSAPLPGSTVNLASANAWLVFTSIRPSVVASTYLSQVQINGASAVAGGNCRVDQYAMGAVIVPQAPSIKPLQVFTGPNFLGISTNFGIYTYYTNAALGTFRWNISSFKLKRGYSATFAQFPDGTGASRVFIAQDGDLEVGQMPATLDDRCNFVRVIPWRWTSKKGWGGGVNTLIEAKWNYDWNNAATSTLDTEYVPMKWGGFTTWDPYSNINGKQGSPQVLGYNEPDSSAQANVTVSNAIALWPQLMQSGLRLGAPAVSDSGVSGQGLDWLYSFMNQATNLGYRVDFVPIHFYKCGWTTTQFSNYLAGVYQTTGRPIWVTEFNYGADWCSSTDQGTEATMIASHIAMLESAPFVERYAIYNWFADTNRAMIINGVLTPAGTNYLRQQSGLAYAQEPVPGGARGIAQFAFEGDTLDSSGYANNLLAAGVPIFTSGHSGQAMQLDGTNGYLKLPVTIATNRAFSFAAWVYWDGGSTWQRIFDFGNGTTQYMFLTPNSGTSTLRFAITTNSFGNEQIIEAAAPAGGQWYHVAVTLTNGSAKLYLNGAQMASSASFTLTPAILKPAKNYLGKSQFAADPIFRGRLDDVLITDCVLTAAQIAALQTNTPPAFTSNVMDGGTATIGTVYSGSIVGSATDADSGDTLTYSKSSGPAWLTIATDGTLSGIPTATDGGVNNFTVRVADAAGVSALAMFTIVIPYDKGNGIWYVDAAGNWSDTSKWVLGCPANGSGLIADFSVLDIAASRTITLTTSPTIGTLKFSDYNGAQTWTLAGSGANTLTLDSGSTTPPSIVVGVVPTLSVGNAVTISASLAGTNGLAKSGPGDLYLTGVNSLSGTLYLDTSSTSSNDGSVRLGSPNAGTNLTAIYIRNNNSGSSTLELAGGATTTAAVTLSGRNVALPAIENISGSNTLAGTLSINSGGGYYLLQSDAGTLNFGGGLTSLATGVRNFTFQGAGDHYLSGPIQNGSATTINLTKLDAGNLIFAGANTFTGSLIMGGGTAKLNSPATIQSTPVNLMCVASNALKFGAFTGAAIGSISGLGDVWLTNASFAALTLTNGGNNASTTYAGAFRGSGGIVKTGVGTLTLAGTNAYTGSTTIAGGTVKFSLVTNAIAMLQPALWLSFDSASGGVVTNQGYGGWGLNGTVTGTNVLVAGGGRFGNGLLVSNGPVNTGYVLVNSPVVNFNNSGVWTWGMWIKSTTAGGAYMYQGDGGWASGNTSFYLNAGGTSPGTKGGGVRYAQGWQTGTATLNDGTWHFISMTCNAGTKTFYVDGNVDAWAATSWSGNGNGSQLWIGGTADTGDGNAPLNGMIDEVVVFSRALSQAEIRSIYTNAPVSGKLPEASTVNIASGTMLDLSGISQTIGALSDYNGAAGVVTNSSSVPVMLTLNNGGGTVQNFTGNIADASGANAISLVKIGAGTQVLSGANSYRGTTTVSNGQLIVSGSLGTNAVAVRGGLLAGNGVIAGAVTVYNTGVVSPGSNSIALLTVSNSVTLNAGVTNWMELNPATGTNDVLRVTGTLNYGGTLFVTNAAGMLRGGTSFKLFSAGASSGNFTTFAGSLGAGLDWKFNPTSGVVTVYSTVPTNLMASFAGSSLQLSWPDDHIGWMLQVQTNDLSGGLGTNWITLPESASSTQFTAPVIPGNPSVFYRLIYQ